MTKLPFDTYLEVVWNDAASHEGWVDIDGDNEPMQIITRGWLVRETPSYVMLAASLQMAVATTVGSTQIIPVGMIVSRRELKVLNARSNTRNKLHPKRDATQVHREQSESGPVLKSNG
jgi:hypothetical protein